MWQIEFTTTKFAPFLPEDAQVNPGVYGFELATWLSKELAAKNIITSYPNEEDWGWFLDYRQDQMEFMICCGSVTEDGSASSGQPLTWTIFIKPLLSISQKLKHVSPDQVIHFLAKSIIEALQTEGFKVTEV